MSQENIAAAEANAQLSHGNGVLIDVRTPAEFREIHASEAKLIPLDTLSLEAVNAVRGETPGPVYLLCASGIRATKAASQLRSGGIEEVVVIEGGTKAWADAGLPVVRGRKTISVERQVRIGAGTLVLTGVLLSWFIRREFIWFSGFIGAGLIFAGISDICGMGIFLAKAPWNRSDKFLG